MTAAPGPSAAQQRLAKALRRWSALYTGLAVAVLWVTVLGVLAAWGHRVPVLAAAILVVVFALLGGGTHYIAAQLVRRLRRLFWPQVLLLDQGAVPGYGDAGTRVGYVIRSRRVRDADRVAPLDAQWNQGGLLILVRGEGCQDLPAAQLEGLEGYHWLTAQYVWASSPLTIEEARQPAAVGARQGDAAGKDASSNGAPLVLSEFIQQIGSMDFQVDDRATPGTLYASLHEDYTERAFQGARITKMARTVQKTTIWMTVSLVVALVLMALVAAGG